MGGALALASGAAAHGRPPPAPSPVVAFHADRLYLDCSGAAEPYRPPAGLRGLEGLDDLALRCLVYHP